MFLVNSPPFYLPSSFLPLFPCLATSCVGKGFLDAYSCGFRRSWFCFSFPLVGNKVFFLLVLTLLFSFSLKEVGSSIKNFRVKRIWALTLSFRWPLLGLLWSFPFSLVFGLSFFPGCFLFEKRTYLLFSFFPFFFPNIFL